MAIEYVFDFCGFSVVFVFVRFTFVIMVICRF